MEFVQEALKGEGWFVVRCPGGSTAHLLLSSGIRYDLLMFDEELMGTSGIELVRLARSLEHRKRTPVILLSPKGGAAETWRAGARVFVRKPQPFQAVVEAVRHLLDSNDGK
ncbi:MAG TPA: response regulator [Pyrinomonadaceae bacterium]